MILRQSFIERDAEGPDIRSRKHQGLRRSIRSSQRPATSRLSCRRNAIGGKLDVVTNRQDIRRLDSGMYKPVFMQKIQRFQNRQHHAASFVGRQRPLRQQIAQIFIGEFGDHIETGRAIDRKAAKMINAQYSRMAKRCSGLPAR